jgi:hypothetical protein
LKYYNEFAAARKDERVVTSYDQYKNPAGSKFDLGREGAFTEFRLLVGNFFHRTKEFDEHTFKLAKLSFPLILFLTLTFFLFPLSFSNKARRSLQTLGFFVEYVEKESLFAAKLREFDVAWIISSDALDWNMRTNSRDEGKWKELALACREFHELGGGLFIFADNDPFFDHANVILKLLADMELEGNTPANQILTLGSFERQRQFGPHLITAGLENLYEGDTVPFAKNNHLGKLQVLATSSDNNPVIFYGDNEDSKNLGNCPGKLARGVGRIVVDTGFSKLWKKWDTAGKTRNQKCCFLVVKERLSPFASQELIDMFEMRRFGCLELNTN